VVTAQIEARAGERLPHALGVILRVLAAVPAGYALGAMTALVAARHLPGPARDAAQAGMMLGFLVHGGVVIWVFAAASAARAWVWLCPFAVALLLAWRLP
jgi:apolipoprotein N-acyltransferase